MSEKQMFDIHRQEMNWGGKTLVLETGKVARQALGAVVASYGETVVLCTVTASKDPVQGVDFLPLSVHYLEKAYAAGKFPGGFLKRENKPSDMEVLTSRLIDRGLRPLFPANFSHEVQILCTVLSYDAKTDPAITAMIGASAALALSGLPIESTLGSVRLGYEQDAFVINPSLSKKTDLDMVMSGTLESVLMVECEGQELPESLILEAIEEGTKHIHSVIQMIDTLAQQANRPAWSPSSMDEENTQKRAAAMVRVRELASAGLATLCSESHRTLREDKLRILKKSVVAELETEGHSSQALGSAFKTVWRDIARSFILKNKRRLDGRLQDEIRNIFCETGILPRTHGSALFTRGDTQALVTATLGGKEDAQLVDNLSGNYRDAFLLHYNFPSFSVGEVGRVGAPGRREMGHGRLAWRALKAVLPKVNPYTVRVVSEITESCGSSSMATVCGGSLALMDAGVRITNPVAGIAMGLVCEKDLSLVLSDISALEDSVGDMDFKVAGTAKGITALQMDLKTVHLSKDLLVQVLEQAKTGLAHILECMAQQGLGAPRESLSPHAPCVATVRIPADKIRDLIGTGGKNIKQLCEETNSKIDVAEDGLVTVFSQNTDGSKKTLERINMLTGSPIMGEVYEGTVVKIMDFGAFIRFGFSDDGLVHISEIANHRLDVVTEVLTVGQAVRVRFIGLDPRGRTKLSIRQAL